MDTRERFINTVLGKPVDRGVFWPDHPWPEGRTRWLREGMTEGQDFGFDPVDGVGRPDFNIGYDPPWETGVIEDEGSHALIRNMYGIIQRVSKDVRKDIAQYVSFPVGGREDWERLRPRLDPDSGGRFPDTWDDQISGLRDSGIPITFGGTHLCGFFSFLRELCGDEEVMYLFYDDPELTREILDFQVHRLTTLLDKIVSQIHVDRMFIWEDMCYKNGPLISPATFREFILEPYQRTIEFAKARGVQIFDVDSDGNVLELLPLWIEAGVNMVHPFEVQAGMDVVSIKKDFGSSLSIRGGIDKRELAKDRSAIDRELERVRPAYEMGGYIPHADHSVPPDVSFDNFKYYTEKRARLVGL